MYVARNINQNSSDLTLHSIMKVKEGRDRMRIAHSETGRKGKWNFVSMAKAHFSGTQAPIYQKVAFAQNDPTDVGRGASIINFKVMKTALAR